MASITLKVSNRTPKKPIKKLPTSIEVTETTTVQDVKNQLANQAGGWDPNQLGLFDPENKKILKDRKALISQHKEVMAGKEIMVKDLGLQMSWSTVFVIEYAGPILFHVAIPLLRKYIYSSAPPLSTSQWLSMGMIIAHFAKREYETMFVHKFSLATMPVFPNLFKNSFHYWVTAGLNIAYWIYSPSSYTALTGPIVDAMNVVGVVLYIFGEIANFQAHLDLSKLRTRGGTERAIPRGFGFDLVTCPNYLFELIAWIGIALVTKSFSTVIFNVFAWWQMKQWAIKKEKALRSEFPDKYKKKKSVIFPTPGALIKYITG